MYPYRPVLFRDINNDFMFLTRSTIEANDKTKMVKWKDGQAYPCFDLPTTAKSHAFYIGKKSSVVETSRTAKFYAKFYGGPKKTK